MPAPSTLEEILCPLGVSDTGIEFIGDEGESRAYSYHELARRALNFGHMLRERGLQPGECIALALENDLHSVVALLGAWCAGAHVASIPQARIGARALYARGIGSVLAGMPLRAIFGSRSVATALPKESVIDPRVDDPLREGPRLQADAPQSLLTQFTSGSTGDPKGVVLGKTAVLEHVRTIGRALDLDSSRDRAVSWLPLSHDMGLIGFLFTALAHRVPLVLVSPRFFGRNPRGWLRLCATHRATVTGAPDFAYRLVADALVATEELDCRSLRVCLVGGERVNWRTLIRFHEVAERFGLAWEALMPVYGMAEATLAVSFPKIGGGPRRGRGGHVCLGQPLPGMHVGFDVDCRTESRIRLKGVSMFDGYTTVSGFEQPFSEDGWFETNDLGFEDEGELCIVGRADEVVVSRGRNIFAEDVEMLALSTPGTLAAAAFRLEESSTCFGLAVEILSGEGVEPQGAREIAKVIQQVVARGLDVRVSAVIVLRRGALPKTTSGKVQRRHCRTLCDRGWPKQSVLATLS